MATYQTLDAAARAYGAHQGITGGRGGWLRKDGKSFGVQGWHEYGQVLVDKGVIQPQDAQGERVDRTRTRYGVRVVSYRAWRELARQYFIQDVFLCEHPREKRGHRVDRGTFDWHYEICEACGGERPEHDEDDRCKTCSTYMDGEGPGHEWSAGRVA